MNEFSTIKSAGINTAALSLLPTYPSGKVEDCGRNHLDGPLRNSKSQKPLFNSLEVEKENEMKETVSREEALKFAKVLIADLLEEYGCRVEDLLEEMERKFNAELDSQFAPSLIERDVIADDDDNSEFAFNEKNYEFSNRLRSMINNCRLKAEAATWQAERCELLENQADFEREIAPRDKQIIKKATELGCFLWMSRKDSPKPDSNTEWVILAECYVALADASDCLNDLIHLGNGCIEFLKEALDLMAEAQSALHSIVDAIHTSPDKDQAEAFSILRELSTAHKVYIQRHMKFSDPANPDDAESISARATALQARISDRVKSERQRVQLLGELQNALGQSEDVKVSEETFRDVVEIVESLIDNGVAPSNPELRSVLFPAVDQLEPMATSSKKLAAAIKSCRSIQRVNSDTSSTTSPDSQPSELVEEARNLLAGGKLVVIGGEERKHHIDDLDEAFDTENIWAGSSKHTSYKNFESLISRSDVAAVVLLVKWASHEFRKIKKYCDKYGKPLVRLGGGYNRNQVAKQLLNQASHRLEKK